MSKCCFNCCIDVGVDSAWFRELVNKLCVQDVVELNTSENMITEVYSKEELKYMDMAKFFHKELNINEEYFCVRFNKAIMNRIARGVGSLTLKVKLKTRKVQERHTYSTYSRSLGYHGYHDTDECYVIEGCIVEKGFKFYDWYKEHIYISDNDKSLCPLCGNALENGSTFGSSSLHIALNEKAKEEAKKEFELIEEEAKKINCQIREVDDSFNDVTTYLRNLVAIENGIQFFFKYLSELFWQEKYLTSILAPNRSKKKIEYKLLEMMCAKWENMEEYIIKTHNLKKPYDMSMPEKPTMEQPESPVLLKVGLFNRQKNKYENEMRLASYHKKMDEYESVMGKYRKLVNEYEDNERLKISFPRQYELLLQKEERELNRINEKKKEIETQISDSYHTPKAQLHELILEEIEETKMKIRELMDCRRQLHAMKVVFPKYLDYVSIVTILEYFESGRCDSLTGKEGAYNIYENESRQNIIINKLDKIAEKLDSIKEGQYLLYTTLLDINKSIESLSDTVKHLEKATSESLADIKDNTAYAAYYSAKTAEYAKRNADLTNALGYLVAFK